MADGFAHVALSPGWGTVLAMAIPIGRRRSLIRALPVGPRVAGHLAFGAVAGVVLRGRG